MIDKRLNNAHHKVHYMTHIATISVINDHLWWVLPTYTLFAQYSISIPP